MTSRIDDREAIAQLVSAIIVHKDKLVVRLNSRISTDEASDHADDRSISIPWQKPPSKRARQILLPSQQVSQRSPAPTLPDAEHN